MTKNYFFIFYVLGMMMSSCLFAASLTTNTTLKPTLTSTLSSSKTTLVSPPYILGFASSSCTKQGAQIIVLGRNFGSRAGLYLGDGRAVIAMNISTWSDAKITATIPKDSRITSNSRFFVGIKNTRSGGWLSNISKYILICHTSENKMAPKSETSFSNISSHHPDAPESVAEKNEGSTKVVVFSNNGSLMDRPLPSLPKKLLLSASKKLHRSKIEPNELIVISNDMKQAQQLAKQLAQYGLRTKKRKKLKHLGIVISTFRVPNKIDLQQTAINIRRAYSGMWADVNHRYSLLSNNRSTLPAKKIINWNKNSASCGKGIRIGLIDTEVNKTHPALRQQKIISYSAITHGIKKSNMEHGTAIASLLIGNHKSKSFSGLLPSASLYAASVFRQRDEDIIDTTAELIVSALDWLISQKVDVINMSIGGPHNLLVDIAIQRTMLLGIPVVAAAGNNGADAKPVYPAAQKGVIAVTAVDIDLSLYNKANEGAYIDFAAPGVDIWVASGNSNGKFLSGTSFSVPFVTASIANIIKKIPGKVAYSKLQKDAKDLGKKGRDKKFGWGLIQHNEKCN